MNLNKQIFTRQETLSDTCRSRNIYLTAHKFDNCTVIKTLDYNTSRLDLFTGEKL